MDSICEKQACFRKTLQDAEMVAGEFDPPGVLAALGFVIGAGDVDDDSAGEFEAGGLGLFDGAFELD
jgi:hypothetical protein